MVVQLLVTMTCCVFASGVLCVVARIAPIENTLEYSHTRAVIKTFPILMDPDLVVMGPGDAREFNFLQGLLILLPCHHVQELDSHLNKNVCVIKISTRYQ